ncbi:hypothetical protein [Cellulomonas sp. Leaf395]|uniref:hypothetical protein n=1 Tax=Cellulomonas sp. Leaf395 TaxID=1736362 RepID=UPI0006FE9681|nr:hypothetical protein [Cellulomonas sp. Leaf395]KQS96999.1 hypothetical protein ASG23_15455 [Cellulomonas sp. Leaf395]
MYDPGRYVAGDAPLDVHNLWADFGDTCDNMLIANGFQTENQMVWQQTVTPCTCATGSNITFDVTAEATNILPLSASSDGGANISVYVGTTLIGQEDLTGFGPGNPPFPPSIGGKTIGFWNEQKNGTAAGAPLWSDVYSAFLLM